MARRGPKQGAPPGSAKGPADRAGPTRHEMPQKFVNLVNKRTRRRPSFANLCGHLSPRSSRGDQSGERSEILFCAGRIAFISVCVGLGAMRLAAAADLPYPVKSAPRPVPTVVPD